MATVDLCEYLCTQYYNSNCNNGKEANLHHDQLCAPKFICKRFVSLFQVRLYKVNDAYCQYKSIINPSINRDDIGCEFAKVWQ